MEKIENLELYLDIKKHVREGDLEEKTKELFGKCLKEIVSFENKIIDLENQIDVEENIAIQNHTKACNLEEKINEIDPNNLLNEDEKKSLAKEALAETRIKKQQISSEVSAYCNAKYIDEWAVEKGKQELLEKIKEIDPNNLLDVDLHRPEFNKIKQNIKLILKIIF